MLALSIGILWFAVGVIILAAIIWVALWGVRQFVPMPPKVETFVWVVFLLIALIYLLVTLEGGGFPHPSFR